MRGTNEEATTPPPDERYVTPSTEMLARADREFFRKLGLLCRSGIRPRIRDGARVATRPMGDFCEDVLRGPRWTALLIPLPRTGELVEQEGQGA